MDPELNPLILIGITWGIGFCLAGGFFAMMLAERKGRSSASWFLLGFAFNVLAVVTLGFLPDRQGKVDSIPSEEKKPWKCPQCANTNSPEIFRCSKCGYTLI